MHKAFVEGTLLHVGEFHTEIYGLSLRHVTGEGIYIKHSGVAEGEYHSEIYGVSLMLLHQQMMSCCW